MLRFWIFLSALSLTILAAYFSVFGIAKIFSNDLFVIIMASAMELGKVVAVGTFYRLRRQIPFTIKTYIISAILILMLITSIGVYGYLHSSYYTTQNQIENIIISQDKNNNKIDEINNINENITVQLTFAEMQINTLVNRSNQMQIRMDSLLNKNWWNTYRDTKNQYEIIQKDISEKQTEIDSLRIEYNKNISLISDLKNDNLSFKSTINGMEIGPIIFISQLLNTSVNTVVNILIIFFTFVLDPLAIVLWIILNYTFNVKQNQYESTVRKETFEKRKDLLGENNTNENTSSDLALRKPERESTTPREKDRQITVPRDGRTT